MHLLKFKTNDKKEENTDNEELKTLSDDRTIDIEKTDIEVPKSSKIGNNNKKNATESHEENQTNQAAKLDIPSKQELVPILEELAAYIYQLEFNRGNKYDVKENRQKDWPSDRHKNSN